MDADLLFNDDLWAVGDDEQLARHVLEMDAPESIDTQLLSPHSYPSFFRAIVLRELLDDQCRPQERPIHGGPRPSLPGPPWIGPCPPWTAPYPQRIIPIPTLDLSQVHGGY